MKKLFILLTVFMAVCCFAAETLKITIKNSRKDAELCAKVRIEAVVNLFTVPRVLTMPKPELNGDGRTMVFETELPGDIKDIDSLGIRTLIPDEWKISRVEVQVPGDKVWKFSGPYYLSSDKSKQQENCHDRLLFKIDRMSRGKVEAFTKGAFYKHKWQSRLRNGKLCALKSGKATVRMVTITKDKKLNGGSESQLPTCDNCPDWRECGVHYRIHKINENSRRRKKYTREVKIVSITGNEIKYSDLKGWSGIITNAEGVAFASWAHVQKTEYNRGKGKLIFFCPGYKYRGKLRNDTFKLYPNKSLIIPEPTTERLYAWKKNGERMAAR
jgi:hypothetical protein